MKTILSLIIFSFSIVTLNSFGQDKVIKDSIANKIVKAGDKFDLKFETCRTCGYDWKINNSYDTTKLKLIGVSSKRKNIVIRTGGNEIKTWKFQALAKGDYKLIFIYKRAWLTEIAKKTIVYIKVE